MKLFSCCHPRRPCRLSIATVFTFFFQFHLKFCTDLLISSRMFPPIELINFIQLNYNASKYTERHTIYISIKPLSLLMKCTDNKSRNSMRLWTQHAPQNATNVFENMKYVLIISASQKFLIATFWHAKSLAVNWGK